VSWLEIALWTGVAALVLPCLAFFVLIWALAFWVWVADKVFAAIRKEQRRQWEKR
jgi:hypothetical protein